MTARTTRREDFDYALMDPTTWEVLGDRYLVRMMDVADIMYGAIAVPDQGEMKRGWAAGRVVAVGGKDMLGERLAHRLERDEWVPMFYGVGDVVVFERLSGKDFHIGMATYRMISQINVLARVPSA